MALARHRPCPHGFTLVELLVVVAIIVTLLAILMPSMNRAIALSQGAVCLSNERQSGVALLAYASDHNGLFPPPSEFIGGTQISWGWRLYTDGYMDAPNVMACPTNLGGSGSELGGDLGQWDASKTPTTGDNANQYYIFGMWQGSTTGNGHFVSSRLSTLKADQFMLTESLRVMKPHVDFYLADRYHVVFLKHEGRASTWYVDGSARPTDADYFENRVKWGTLVGDPAVYGITTTTAAYDQ